MTNYKLTYFNIRARGEPIRLMLILAGQKFEDYRMDVEDWSTQKKGQFVIGFCQGPPQQKLRPFQRIK